jgi:hypothetical protein
MECMCTRAPSSITCGFCFQKNPAQRAPDSRSHIGVPSPRDPSWGKLSLAARACVTTIGDVLLTPFGYGCVCRVTPYAVSYIVDAEFHTHSVRITTQSVLDGHLAFAQRGRIIDHARICVLNVLHYPVCRADDTRAHGIGMRVAPGPQNRTVIPLSLDR